MDFQEEITEIISGTFKNIQQVLAPYKVRGNIFFKVFFGIEGTGHELSVEFFQSRFEGDKPQVRIEIWLNPGATGFVLIYSALMPDKSEDKSIEQFSVNITNMDEALPYFEKAIRVFKLPEVEME